MHTTSTSSCDTNGVYDDVWGDRDRGERLALSVDEVLDTLPLHLERSLRDHFGLAENPRLEDILPGTIEDALRALKRSDRAEILREFV